MNDITRLKQILTDKSMSPFCSTISGWTPLHFAAAYGHVEACNFLVKNGAPMYANGIREISALHVAAHFCRIDVFKALIIAGSDPEAHHMHGQNAVFEIFTNSDFSGTPECRDLLKWLIYGQDKYLIDVQARDFLNRGVLHYALYSRSKIQKSKPKSIGERDRCIRSILKTGARADTVDVHGMSALHHACDQGDQSLV